MYREVQTVRFRLCAYTFLFCLQAHVSIPPCSCMMGEHELVERFRRLHITTSSDEDFKTSANSLLDQIIAYAHMSKDEICEERASNVISEQELSSFITYGCKILDRKNQLLKSKFADAIHLMLVNQQKVLPKEILPQFLSFLRSCLTQSTHSLRINFLQALGASFYANGANIDLELLEDLVGATSFFWSFLDPEHNNYVVQLNTVECLGNLCQRSSSGQCIEKSFIRLFFQQVIDFLRSLLRLEDTDDLELFELIAESLKVLQKIIVLVNFQDQIIEPEFAIALLRVFVIYGLPNFRRTVTHSIRNLPSTKTAPEFGTDVVARKSKSPIAKQVVRKKRKGKKNNNKKQMNLQDEEHESHESAHEGLPNQAPIDSILRFDISKGFVSSQSSSESEFSDSESGHRQRLRSMCCRIRQNCCKCIYDILKVSNLRTKLSSWLLLVPELSSQNEPSLLRCFKEDPSPKVRLLALTTLMELINDSKQYLEAAVDRSQSQPSISRSFVPFSVKLNQSLLVLHEAFLDQLEEKRLNIGNDKVLQCLSILILNTPYEKIGTDNLYRIFQAIPKFLLDQDTNVIISALTCLAATLSVRPKDPKIESMLLRVPRAVENHNDSFEAHVNIFKSWLLRYCYYEMEREHSESISDATNQKRIKSQCLQLLKIIVQFYPAFITSHERKSLVGLVSAKFINMSECTLPLHSIKLIEEFGKSFSKIKSENERGDERLKRIELDEIEFWKGILDGPMTGLFQSHTPVFKLLSAVCDALSTISGNCFERLNVRYQIMMKTILLGAADDVDVLVKSAAVRALGVFVTYPYVNEDKLFLIDVGRVIFKQLKSPSLNVRMKAGWSLGNFTDSVLRNRVHDTSDDQADFSEDFIIELLSASKNASLDHDKVKPNGVRAIGNVLKWISSYCSGKTFLENLIDEAVEALIQNISTGPMKARWNACYACMNMFQGNALSLGKTDGHNRLLAALGSAMKECKNFKVRISAANALSSLKTRQHYGDIRLFGWTWKNAVESLVSSENLSDFTEFKFKSNLQNKICHLLCHLLSIALPDDLPVIQSSISENSALINDQIAKYLDEVAKEQLDSQDQQVAIETFHKDININCLIGNLSQLGSLRMILAKLSTI